MRTILAVAYCLMSSVATAGPCDKQLSDLTGEELRQTCQSAGYPAAGSNPLSCTDDEMTSAKRAVDWALFQDPAAMDIVMETVEARKASCNPVYQARHRVWVGVQNAQADNLQARCTLYHCQFRMIGENGYLQELVQGGKIDHFMTD